MTEPIITCKGYRVAFASPVGIYHDIIVADTPQQALQYAMQRTEKPDFNLADFEENDRFEDTTDYRVQQITVLDQDGQEEATWSDPEYLVEKHSAEILELLETLIDAIDDAIEARNQVNEEIGNVEAVSADASRTLNRLRLKGGAQ